MIFCVGLNPALDRRIRLHALELGSINRALSAEARPGGKAANVTLSVRALGSPVRFIGLLGGPTGQAVEQGLSALGIQVEVIRTVAATRINLELIDARGVTEVLEPGSPPTPEEQDLLFSRCHNLFEKSAPNSVVAFSGSSPPGAATDLYARLIRLAKAHGLRVILDTSGPSLERGLEARPDFVKPNREEAQVVLHRPIATPLDAKEAVNQLISRGAGAAIVSLGSAGLVGLSGDRALLISPPVLDSPSSVGCGDATVAGLAVALERGYEPVERLTFAAACGAANCLARSPGCLDTSTVESLRRQMVMTWLE